MASHKEILKESCERLWRLLDKLNSSPTNAANDPKDAEQYHQIMSALADSVGLKMAEQAEEERENGAAYRGGGTYAGGIWWDPYRHGAAYTPGGMQENSAAYNGGYYGPGEWDGMTGAGQRRDQQGRYAREGMRRGGTYGGAAYNDGMVARLEDMMETAPASERRHFEKVLEHIENKG